MMARNIKVLKSENNLLYLRLLLSGTVVIGSSSFLRRNTQFILIEHV